MERRIKYTQEQIEHEKSILLEKLHENKIALIHAELEAASLFLQEVRDLLKDVKQLPQLPTDPKDKQV